MTKNDQDKLYRRLVSLLHSQMNSVIQLSGAPVAFIPPETVALADRATKLMDWANQSPTHQQRLLSALNEVAPQEQEHPNPEVHGAWHSVLPSICFLASVYLLKVFQRWMESPDFGVGNFGVAALEKMASISFFVMISGCLTKVLVEQATFVGRTQVGANPSISARIVRWTLTTFGLSIFCGAGISGAGFFWAPAPTGVSEPLIWICINWMEASIFVSFIVWFYGCSYALWPTGRVDGPRPAVPMWLSLLGIMPAVSILYAAARWAAPSLAELIGPIDLRPARWDLVIMSSFLYWLPLPILFLARRSWPAKQVHTKLVD